MKVGGTKTWKELTIGVQQLVRLLFNNNFIDAGRVLEIHLVLAKISYSYFSFLALEKHKSNKRIRKNYCEK